MSELYNVFKSLGCEMIDYMSQEASRYEESEAAQRGSFYGLLDTVNKGGS